MPAAASPNTRELDVRLAVGWFHALSDPTRLEIVERLAGGERCVCELTADLDAAQSRLSFHLRTLKDAGLVTDRREGRWVYYGLVPEALEQIGSLVGSLGERSRETGRPRCC
jgi:ArsR family transcriptional regulator